MNKPNVFKKWHKYVFMGKRGSDCVIPTEDTEVPPDLFLQFKEVPFSSRLENNNTSHVTE